MSRGRRIFKRFIFFLLAFLVFMAGSLYLVASIYKDELIDHFVTSMNERLNTPVNVGSIDVSAFAHFPEISVIMKGVDVRSSLDEQDTLLFANQMDFSLNTISLLTGEIVFSHVTITDGACWLITQEDGRYNYNIFNKQDSSAQESALKLSRISLDNVNFSYLNEAKNIKLITIADKLNASVDITGAKYDIWGDGNVLLSTLEKNGQVLSKDLETNLTAEISYDNQVKHITILPSIIQPDDNPVIVKGEYNFGDSSNININATAESLEATALLKLLPPSLREPLAAYSPFGAVNFNMSYHGEWTEEGSPALDMDFKLQNVSLKHRDSGESLEAVTGTGTLAFGNTQFASSGKLLVRNMKALFDDYEITAKFQIQNFSEPRLSLESQGTLEVAKFLEFYPIGEISKGEGLVSFDLTYDGAIKKLQKSSIKNIKTSGKLNLEDVNLQFTSIEPELDINGTLNFDNNTVRIDQLSGDFGNSDFSLQGEFKNALTYLLLDNQKIGIEASLSSEFIDLDELLSLQPTSESGPYSFRISPLIQAHFDCDIQALKFRRFSPKNISGDFKIRNQVAFSDQLRLDAMGGSMDLLGMADASRDNVIRISSNAVFNNIAIDSVFYVFENFDQTFLEDRHLKGFLDADVGTSMILSRNLKLYPETLRAGISASISKGELNNFTPLMKLAPYLDEAELQHLRFSDIRNDILIKDRTIFLPPMEIGSNATDLIVSGTHTFAQKINYKVQTPLIATPKNDSDERFGAIEKDASGRSMLFLQITGTTSEYYVSLDKQTVKQKIATDLKKEKAELKEIFKNKGKIAEDVELAEEEYFEWDNDSIR